MRRIIYDRCTIDEKKRKKKNQRLRGQEFLNEADRGIKSIRVKKKKIYE